MLIPRPVNRPRFDEGLLARPAVPDDQELSKDAATLDGSGVAPA